MPVQIFGIPFNGSAPDIGWYETGNTLPNAHLLPMQGRGNHSTHKLRFSFRGAGTDPEWHFVWLTCGRKYRGRRLEQLLMQIPPQLPLQV